MTDTIDVAALPSTAEVKRMVAWLRTMNLGNGSATTDAIATALQSQADALAEARRNSDIAFRAAIDSGEALENAQERNPAPVSALMGE